MRGQWGTLLVLGLVMVCFGLAAASMKFTPEEYIRRADNYLSGSKDMARVLERIANFGNKTVKAVKHGSATLQTADKHGHSTLGGLRIEDEPYRTGGEYSHEEGPYHPRHGPKLDWPQWGQDAAHHGYLPVKGQRLRREFLRFQYDPLVLEEIDAEDDGLSVHYMTPLARGKQVIMMVKDPESPFNPGNFSTQTWGVTAFTPDCDARTYRRQWTTYSTWKAPGSLLSFWEPVFHGAVAGNFLYVPAAQGGVHKINPDTGTIVATITPVPNADANYVTTSPLTVDKHGRLYYTVVHFDDPVFPYAADVHGSWLVVIPTQSSEQPSVVNVTGMGALPEDGKCVATFSRSDLPWPPSPDAVPPSILCGTLRAGINIAPAVGPDGTVVIVLRAHFASRYSFVVALTPELTVKWASSTRERLVSGCGVPLSEGGMLPPNGEPGGCRDGANYGVDPATNSVGSGRVLDDSSSSPVIGPDGAVYWGAYTRYNYEQGHIMKWAPDGRFVTWYSFGWDTTPGIYARPCCGRHGAHSDGGYGKDGDTPASCACAYSLITKENHYNGVGSYCFDEPFCPPSRPENNPEAYWITQLSTDLSVEWQWQSTNKLSCKRNSDNSISCVEDHPNGFEWCVNAPAIDQDGTVYVNSEDGWLYTIAQGGRMVDKIFQQQALGAAYTPASLNEDGLILTQNTGTLFVIGEHLCNPPHKKEEYEYESYGPGKRYTNYEEPRYGAPPRY